MKLALIGYGKMGKEVEQTAKQAGFEIARIIDPLVYKKDEKITAGALKDSEVCIDFTTPTAVLGNIKQIAACKKNIVVGTTGWYDHLAEVEQVVHENKIGLIYAANFSIGINIFFKVIERSAVLINNFSDYDPYILEMHHAQKADSPSGTALQLGQILLENLDKKNNLLTKPSVGRIPPESIPVASVRAGVIFGTHVVGFDSPYDRLELRHEALSRRGFAQGALLAAKWIAGKTGLFRFSDIFEDLTDQKGV